MIYRIILSVGYNKAWFDFDTIEEAAEFAKTVLIHQSPNSDTTKKDSIRMEIIDTSIKVEKDEEEDE